MLASTAVQVIPNSDITIYNKYILNRAEKYQRFEITAVVWQATSAISRAKEQVSANSALIMIPFAYGANYLKPKAWQTLADKSGYWTLQEGDVIARGVVTEEIDTEYKISDLRADYDEVVTIHAIAAMDEGSANVRHWEVNCK